MFAQTLTAVGDVIGHGEIELQVARDMSPGWSGPERTETVGIGRALRGDDDAL